MVRESRHLWVGNLPETVNEAIIQEFFQRFGRVEKVKLLAKTSPDGGRAAFVDFVDIRSATKANEAQNRMGERELRTNYNEPGVKNFGHMHRFHGPYPHGLDYGRQPVVIYAAPPPPGDLNHPLGYRQVGYQPHAPPPPVPPYTGPPPPNQGIKREGSLGRRSPSVDSKHSHEYSSDSDDSTDKNSPPASVVIKNLPRNPDNMLEEGLYHEFRKCGEISKIKLKGTPADRYAIIKFTKPEEAERATHSTGRQFQGQNIRVLIRGAKKRKAGSPDRGDDLAFDPHATRTVFVGNIEKTMMHGELRAIFERFGDVVDVDIKKMQQGVTTYAFVQYIDINGAVLAKRKMDREYIGPNVVKIGYGRGTPTNSLWIGNIPLNTMEHELSKPFHQFGFVQRCLIDKRNWQALIRFETIESCTRAFAEMHGKYLLGKRIAVDYASPACRDGFYRRMEEDGQLDRRQLEPSPTPPDAHINFQHVVRGGAYQPRNQNFVHPFTSIDPRVIHPQPPQAEFNPKGLPGVPAPPGSGDIYGRDKERPRGYSPMSRGSVSPKRMRESISPVSSSGYYDRDRKYRADKKKKRKYVYDSPPREEPPRKKDKRKRKKELKREKKEKKRQEKQRKKAEKKQKKLEKAQRKAALKSEAVSSTPAEPPKEELKPPDVPQPPAMSPALVNMKVENGEVISPAKPAEPEQTNGAAEEGAPLLPVIKQEKDDEMPAIKQEKLDDDEAKSKNLIASPEDGELHDDDVKPDVQPTPGSPISQDEVSTEETKGAVNTPVKDEKPAGKPPPPPPVTSESRRSSVDSSDSSDDSSSSDSDSSDSSSSDGEDSDDARRYRRREARKDERRSRGREPKAYRQSNRGSDFESREKDYRRKYADARRSPPKKRRSRSPESPPPVKRESSYDRRRVRSPSKSPKYERNNHKTRTTPPPPPPAEKIKTEPNGAGQATSPPAPGQSADTLMDLLRRYPVMWQGLLGLKNDTAAVQMHFLSGNVRLAETSLPRAAQANEVPPTLRISQRMKLEPSQLDGVEKRIQTSKEHCMLLALPCGRDPLDVHAQTRALKTGFIQYLQQKQAAGIINAATQPKQPSFVVHIFPPCEFAQGHLARVAPDLLSSAADSGHLMVLISPV